MSFTLYLMACLSKKDYLKMIVQLKVSFHDWEHNKLLILNLFSSHSVYWNGSSKSHQWFACLLIWGGRFIMPLRLNFWWAFNDTLDVLALTFYCFFVWLFFVCLFFLLDLLGTLRIYWYLSTDDILASFVNLAGI